MSIKDKIQEAKRSTKVAVVGGALIIAGSWGSCQLELGEQDAANIPEAEEAPAEEPAKDPSQAEPESLEEDV
jgi:hypothetical protein